MVVVDRYTKAVLTVIAASLMWLCALQSGLPIEAKQRVPQRPADVVEGPAQPVVIVGWGVMDLQGRISLARTRGATDPNVPVKVADLPRPVDVRVQGPVDARLPYSEAMPLPIGVSQVKPAGEWEPLRVSVEDAPVRSRPGRGGQ
jgi:hypothetical protein